MPLFPLAILITGGMLLLTLPILSGALLMVLADLHSNGDLIDELFFGQMHPSLDDEMKANNRVQLPD